MGEARFGQGIPACARPEREKAAADRGFSMLDFPKETGAGEAIRTLDPNLGKCVLHGLPRDARVYPALEIL
jgi:hypothetical protein